MLRYYIKRHWGWHEISKKMYNRYMKKPLCLSRKLAAVECNANIQEKPKDNSMLDALVGQICHLETTNDGQILHFSLNTQCQVVKKDSWYMLVHDGEILYSVQEADYGQHWAKMKQWAKEHGYMITNYPGGKS